MSGPPFFKDAPKRKRKRRGIKPVSDKKRAANFELARVRDEVNQRSGGMCEARILEVCTGSYEHAHHKRRRSQGGPDTAANLLACCEECHRRIHSRPTWAMENGFLIGAGE